MTLVRTLAGLFAAGAACLGAAQAFVVEPYIQPGDAPRLDREERVVLWETEPNSVSFAVELRTLHGRGRGVVARPISTPWGTVLYEAPLRDLAFDSEYTYTVRRGGSAVFQGSFRTRTRGDRIQFAVVGDSGNDSSGQRLTALGIWRSRPDFIVHTGDYVYNNGRASEYRRNLFPIYNAASALPSAGAPLLRSIPLYVAFGNHDFNSLNLGQFSDGLAGFIYNRLPMNGPSVASPPHERGESAAFLLAAEARWPRMSNYSFDVGNAHFAMLDANSHVDPTDPKLVEWLERDLRSTRATWKFVAFHQPGFHSSIAHYEYQRMRLLAPVFERLGVDVVFSGHVHNYQRSAPLRFAPAAGLASNGLVKGAFQIDQAYDGKTRTRPHGVIYVVTGAGGASFYDPTFTGKPALWKRPGDTWAPFTRAFVADRFSFTDVSIQGRRFQARQLDPFGNALDAFTIDK